MKRILAFLLFMASPAMASFSGYTYQRQLSVNHVSVSTGQLTYSNFPVLVQFTDVKISTSSSGGHLLNANGYDLVFSTMSDCSFLLNWDTETINTTGISQSNIWVNLPAISSSTDTPFYECYGNAGITTYQGISTATWDTNFVGVWHLGTSTGTTPNIKDSSISNSTTTNVGVIASTGQIDGAGSFSAAATNYVNVGSGANIVLLQLPMTISAWYNAKSFSPTLENNIFSDNSTNNFVKKFAVEDGIEIIAFTSSPGSPCGQRTNIYTGAGNPVSLNTWHYAAMTTTGTLAAPLVSIEVDGNAPQLFSPGAMCTTPAGAASLIGTTQSLSSTFIFPWDGFIDEVRESNINRTADWLKTEYKNQNSPSTFVSIGSEMGGPVPISIQINGTVSVRGNQKVL